MHRAKGDRLVRASELPVCDNDISHSVKFAHVVKIYVAYMRNFHIDKNTPNLLHFAIDSKSSHICQDFITWFKQIELLKGH